MGLPEANRIYDHQTRKILQIFLHWNLVVHITRLSVPENRNRRKIAAFSNSESAAKSQALLQTSPENHQNNRRKSRRNTAEEKLRALSKIAAFPHFQSRSISRTLSRSTRIASDLALRYSHRKPNRNKSPNRRQFASARC